MTTATYATEEVAYHAGRENGPPPSRRFHVLDAPREDLLTQLATAWMLERVTSSLDTHADAWRHVCDALELDAFEAAYLLGLIHDAAPHWQRLLPGDCT